MQLSSVLRAISAVPGCEKVAIFHAVPRPPGGRRGAARCAGRLSYHEARRLCRGGPPEGCPGSWRDRKMSRNAGGGGATARMSDCHQMLVRRAEACEGGWFRAHWHVLGRCDMGWDFSHASRRVFTGMQNTVEVELRPYFGGCWSCAVTRRTRPQTTNQLSPRGQRGCRAAPMRWFERRRLITLYYKCPDGLSDALTRRGFRPETLKTSSRQCGAYPDGAKTASMGPDAAPRITPRIGTRPGIFARCGTTRSARAGSSSQRGSG